MPKRLKLVHAMKCCNFAAGAGVGAGTGAPGAAAGAGAAGTAAGAGVGAGTGAPGAEAGAGAAVANASAGTPSTFNPRENLARSLRVYAVTDRHWLGLPATASEEDARTALCAQVRAALAGGATFVQMREKHLPHQAMVAQAKALQHLCHEANVPFVVNDAVDVALEAHAHGVHIGQDDMSVKEARALLGAHKILGVSAQTVEQAVQAERDGADYLGVGAVFPTSSKDDAVEVSHETLCAICQAVHIPVVAIGGITCENVSELANSGIVGVAVISAIFGARDITLAAGRLTRATEVLLSQ